METSTPCVGASFAGDRLLGVENICDITGLCPVVASKLITETGHEIRLHSHKYILESSFLAFLHEREVG